MISTPFFLDRQEAGNQLGEEVSYLKDKRNLLVLGLPRGGVIVASEVAKHLDAPLDVLLVRKVGVPGHEELAMGAVASGGIRFVNEQIKNNYAVYDSLLDQMMLEEEVLLRQREKLYRKSSSDPPVSGKTVILVDDGLATGATMLAAVKACRVRGVESIIIAVPIATPSAYELLRSHVNKIVSLIKLPNLGAIGRWYKHFPQVTDKEVLEELAPKYKEA